MNIPKDLKYAKSHEWVKMLDEETALIGLTDYAQDALGDLVFVNLPEAGDEVEAGETFADVESVKAVSDVFSPVQARWRRSTKDFWTHLSPLTKRPMRHGSLKWSILRIRKN